MCSVSASRREEVVSEAVLDEDVILEKKRVPAGKASSDLIVIDQLTKVYGNRKVAGRNRDYFHICPGTAVCFTTSNQH